MGPLLGALIDLMHAMLMTAWVLGLPLLFWHRFPWLTRAYAVYAIAFIVGNQLSQAVLGECFLTALARACWQISTDGPAPMSDEWFTVRLSEAVFHLTPSHRSIKIVSEALILATAVGITVRTIRDRRSVRHD